MTAYFPFNTTNICALPPLSFLRAQDADVATALLLVACAMGHTEFAGLLVPFVPDVNKAMVRVASQCMIFPLIDME